jgi:hypothetical protein
MTDLPDPEMSELEPALFDALARRGEQKTRHKRRQAGVRMSIDADGTLGGLGPPPGARRDFVERLAALEDLRTPKDLDRVRAELLEHVVAGQAEAFLREVSWSMIEDARSRMIPPE